MQMKTALWKVPLYSAAALFILVAVWLALVVYLPWQILYWPEIRAADAIIANVEQFRREHGRLPDENKPDEVTALGFELRVGYYPDYRPSGDEYEVVYYFGFDGPRLAYSSKTKTWRCELGCNNE